MGLPADQPVRDQLDYAVAQIRRGGIARPDAFIVSRLRENKAIPPNFETRSKREERERTRTAQLEASARLAEVENACRAYNNTAVDRHIAQNIRPEELDSRITAALAISTVKYPALSGDQLRAHAEREVRQAIAKELNLPTLDEFRAMMDRGELADAA
jgi:hypothetical protein